MLTDANVHVLKYLSHIGVYGIRFPGWPNYFTCQVSIQYSPREALSLEVWYTSDTCIVNKKAFRKLKLKRVAELINVAMEILRPHGIEYKDLLLFVMMPSPI
jgi:hypothetical protein